MASGVAVFDNFFVEFVRAAQIFIFDIVICHGEGEVKWKVCEGGI